jgi:hypothetical protein
MRHDPDIIEARLTKLINMQGRAIINFRHGLAIAAEFLLANFRPHQLATTRDHRHNPSARRSHIDCALPKHRAVVSVQIMFDDAKMIDEVIGLRAFVVEKIAPNQIDPKRRARYGLDFGKISMRRSMTSGDTSIPLATAPFKAKGASFSPPPQPISKADSGEESPVAASILLHARPMRLIAFRSRSSLQ